MQAAPVHWARPMPASWWFELRTQVSRMLEPMAWKGLTVLSETEPTEVERGVSSSVPVRNHLLGLMGASCHE